MKADLEVYYDKYHTGIKVSGPREGLRNIRGIHLDPFKPTQRQGVMPLTPMSLYLLRDAYPKVVVTRRLIDWFSEEKVRREVQETMYNSPSIDSSRLYDFQRQGVAFLKASSKWNTGAVRALIADDPRLGKTVQTLAAVGQNRYTPMLIVTMKPLILYWVDAVEDWGDFANSAIPLTQGSIDEKIKLLKGARPGNIFVINWEVLRKMSRFPSRKFNTIIADEAHIVRNRKAQVTKGFLHLRPNNILLASATPVERGPQDYWTYMHALYPQEFRSYWRWVDWFCVTENVGFGNQIVGVRNIDLLTDLLVPRVLRRRASQVANVPKKIHETVRVEPSSKLKNLYHKVYTEIVAEFEGQSLEIPNKLARMTRLMQISVDPSMIGSSLSSPKAGVISALAQKYEGHQMVVYSSFTAGIKYIVQELEQAGVSCVRYTGNQVQEEAFIRGDVQVLVSNPRVGGIGKDYSNADIIVYFDLPLSATLIRQSVERTTKLDLREPRLIVTLVSTPIEETVAKLVATKLKTVRDVDILTAVLLTHKKTQ